MTETQMATSKTITIKKKKKIIKKANKPLQSYTIDDTEHFINITRPTRQKMNEKGIISFPFEYNAKLKDGWCCKWAGSTESVQPHRPKIHNYAIMTGQVSGIIGIDVDEPKDGERDGWAFLHELIPEGNSMWSTYINKSGSGGRHIYLKYNDKLNKSNSRKIWVNGEEANISIDVRSDGGCLIGEGCKSPAGYYENISGDISNLQEIPEALLECLIEPPKTENKLMKANKHSNIKRDEDNKLVSEDKLKYLALFEGYEHHFNEYGAWFNLCCLCVEHFNFDIFHRISKAASNYEGEADCREQFDNCVDSECKKDFGWLINYAKEKIPEKYEEAFGYISKYIYECDDEGFNQMIYHTYRHKFKFDAENDMWYECIEGLWVKRDKKNLSLRRMIADDLIKIYKKRRWWLAQKLKDLPEDSPEIDIYEARLILIDTAIKWCRSNNKRANFVNAVQDLFCDYDFLKKLDSNEVSGHLFSFTNGYINMNEYIENRNIIFHKHRAQNFVSQTCGYDFVPRGEINMEKFVKLNNLLDDIFTDKTDRSYILQSFGSCMTAGNQNEVCVCLYGRNGGNGKGLIATVIMKEAFGDYCGTFKTANIVGKKSIDPESASSGLAAIMKCRYVYMAEPDKGEEVNNEALKLLTGGDEISYRKLHQNMLKAIPAFTIFLQTNNILNTDCYDDAVWRRLKYIYFGQTFRTNPSEKELAMGWKKADITLKKKFCSDNEWKQAFIHILLDNYVDELKDTENIIKYTELSRNDNDTIRQFCEDCIELCDEDEVFDHKNMNAYGQKKFLTLNQLKVEYSAWHREQYDEDSPFKLKDLKQALISKLPSYKASHKTRIFKGNFVNGDWLEPVEVKVNDRVKQKNHSHCFIGVKLKEDISIEEEDPDCIEL